MDRELVEEKLESLRRCARRVEQKRVSTAEQLAEDWDTQDILSVNLTRAVQLSAHVTAHIVSDSDLPAPETMSEAFDRLHKLGVLPAPLAGRLKGAVGFREVQSMRIGRSIGQLSSTSRTNEWTISERSPAVSQTT